MFQKHLAERNDCARLAGARRHDQQCLPAILGIKTVTDRLNGRLLVVSARDIGIDNSVIQRSTHAIQIEKFLEITF